jgi:hypothetical protein
MVDVCCWRVHMIAPSVLIDLVPITTKCTRTVDEKPAATFAESLALDETAMRHGDTPPSIRGEYLPRPSGSASWKPGKASRFSRDEAHRRLWEAGTRDSVFPNAPGCAVGQHRVATSVAPSTSMAAQAIERLRVALPGPLNHDTTLLQTMRMTGLHARAARVRAVSRHELTVRR